MAGDRAPSLLSVDTNNDWEEMANRITVEYGGVWINCNDEATEGVFICDVDGNAKTTSKSAAKLKERTG